MNLIVAFIVSVLINIALLWYVIRILRKFFFISQNMADLFLTMKAFEVFVSSLYSMQSYHGEPFIQELVARINELTDEMDSFRQIFEYTLDEELEEELNATAEEETFEEK
mgnify:CR=1 FL=1